VSVVVVFIWKSFGLEFAAMVIAEEFGYAGRMCLLMAIEILRIVESFQTLDAGIGSIVVIAVHSKDVLPTTLVSVSLGDQEDNADLRFSAVWKPSLQSGHRWAQREV
jgi:hypothetical protein